MHRCFDPHGVHMSLSLARRLGLSSGPFLCAVGSVLYVGATTGAPWEALVRPIVVVVVLTGLVFAGCFLATRSLPWASALGTAIMLITFRFVLPGMFIGVIALWWLLVRIIRRSTGRPIPRRAIELDLAALSTIGGLALLVLGGWMYVASSAPSGVRLQVPEYQATGRGGPNIYILLLDGHPRGDTLQSTFGIDGQGFLNDLEDRGFAISSQARSNYNKTWATLASALNGEYVDRLLAGSVDDLSTAQQLRLLSSLIREAALLDLMRDRGYSIRTVPSAFVSTAVTSADDYIDAGHITEFETYLIAQAPWTLLVRDQVTAILLADHRQSVTDALDTTVSLARTHGGSPQLVFTHILSPHTPFVLGRPADGSDMPPCFPLDCSFWNPTIQDLDITVEEFRDGLVPQVDELDAMVVEAVDHVIAADPEAVVVIMSDHGIRYSLEDLPEHYRTLLAARTPDGARLFANDESPVNVLRGLGAYLGEDLPSLPYQQWGGSWETFLDLELLHSE
jgi:hypothetical protein